MLSLLSTHNEEITTVHQNVRLQVFAEEMTRRSHASGKPSRLQNLGIMFSPSLGSIQRSVHRLSQFPHTHLAALGSSQSAVDVANCVCVEVGSTHVSSGNLEKILNLRGSDGGVAEKIGSTPVWRTSSHQTRTVTWGFGASCVGIDPLEANWFASCLRPCFRFSGARGSNGPPLTSSSASHS